MDLTISIVNYNNRDFLINCLQSLYENKGKIRFDVFVVDNNSSDDSVKILTEKFPQVKLICNKSNVGFAKANNQVIKQSNARYILLLNPDTKVFDNTLKILVDFMDSNPGAGVLGCKIINPDGSLQLSTFGYPSIIKEFFNITGLDNIFPPNSFFRKFTGKYLSNMFQSTLSRYWNHNEIREVDSVLGACLLIRKEAINDAGLMDENFFMYNEEREWCYRIKKLGWKIYFNPNTNIIHYGNRTSADDLSKDLFVEYYRGIFYFFQKHYSKLELLILKWIFIIGCYGRIKFEKVKEKIQPTNKEKIKDNIFKYSKVKRIALLS